MNTRSLVLPALIATVLFGAGAAWPGTPAWALGFLALLASALTARWLRWWGAAGAVPVAAVVAARPWATSDPIGALLALDPVLLVAIVTAAVAGAWIGFLERHLGDQRRVSQQAQYDPLTGLLNRTAFEAKALEAMGETHERGDLLALLFVDLDRFKVVNDTYGHEIGDTVLRRIANIIRGHVRQADLVGRLGGDEFTVALRGLREPDSAEAVARKLLEVLDKPMEVAGRRIEVGASIGIALFPRDGEDVAELLKNADHAMYQIKEKGRNGVGFSSHETQVRNDRRIRVERQLRAALAEDEFELHYQAQVDLRTGSPSGVELLLRWRNRELGEVSPDEFIPMAEETGLILPLGRWILRQACFQLREWDQKGVPPLTLSVNVSTLQFRQPDFVRAVEDALKDSGVDPARLELEITESVLMTDVGNSVKTLERLGKLGVGIALDDFGTGYSSLSYLRRLPIRTLKIDRSFVAGLVLRGGGEAGGTAPIVETILTLGQKLGKQVVAEGIETREQARWLAEAGCAFGQGYLFSKPLPADRLERMLARTQPAPKRVDPEGDPLLLTG